MDLRKRSRITRRRNCLLIAVIFIAACFDEDKTSNNGRNISGTPGESASEFATQSGSSFNKAPTISGTPPLLAAAGLPYEFAPNAIDIDNDRLGFSIRGKPSWAEFDPNTGRLTGTPAPDDLGVASGIVIFVSDGKMGSALPPFSIRVTGPQKPPELGSDNTPPEIGGNPVRVARVNQLYLFRPVASDLETDRLHFDVVNKPSWLAFDNLSGTLSGFPNVGDVGSYANIWISVSDGTNLAGLGPFSIDVVADSANSIELSWQAPTENEDGSPLLDLGGYRIRYGVEAESYSNLIDISNPGIQTLGVDDLAPDTYYFVVSAYNSRGLESNFSNEAVVSLN